MAPKLNLGQGFVDGLTRGHLGHAPSKLKRKFIEKSTKKSCQNQKGKKAYFHAFTFESWRESDAEAEKADLQKLCKNIIFLCIFWICVDVNKEQKQFGNQCRKASNTIAKIIDFSLKFLWFSASMFGRELLKSQGASWLRFRRRFRAKLAVLARLGTVLGASCGMS